MKKILFIILCLDFLVLFYLANTLSIGYDELIIYNSDLILAYILRFGTFIFGTNDLALRMPLISFHIICAILIYILALKITKTKSDALIAMVLFIVLPGTVASALIVHNASMIILLSLFILCAYEYDYKKSFYVLLTFALFVDENFAILFLALLLYGLYKKDKILSGINIILLILAMFLYDFGFSGKPKGYFIDTLGIYFVSFSPLVFVYFFYTIYHFAFKDKKPLMWFVICTTFMICVVFSFRSKLALENFLPFCVICTPLLVYTFMRSYRVRLARFRLRYTILLEAGIVFLIISYIFMIFNTSLYNFLDKPNKHFAYNYHLAKELAHILKSKNIKGIKTDEKMQKRLEFYGIAYDKNNILLNTHDTKLANIKIDKFKSYFILDQSNNLNSVPK